MMVDKINYFNNKTISVGSRINMIMDATMVDTGIGEIMI